MATRTNAISQALRELLLEHAAAFDGMESMKCVTFEVRLKPGTTTVLRAVARAELEKVFLRD